MTIFSSPSRNSYTSDRSLIGAASLMDALCSGRDDLTLEALGQTLSPWQLVGDAISWGATRHAQTSVSFHLLACACVIHGSLPLLRGLMRRPDFFDYSPNMELREAKPAHLYDGLVLGCALEAIARGRLDILLEISAAETLWRSQPSNLQHHGYTASKISDLHPDHAVIFLHHLAHSRNVPSAPLIACALWVRDQLCSPPHDTPVRLDARFAALWLDAACDAGRGDAIDHALALGARPSRHHVTQAAANGALDLATRMASISRATRSSSASSREAGRETRGASESCSIAESMASSFDYALDKIADGYFHWRRLDDAWIETTYSDFLTHRATLIANAVQVLSGGLDMPEDLAPAELPLRRKTGLAPQTSAASLLVNASNVREKAKDQLASSARAMARLAPASSSTLELLALDNARPGARVLAPELVFMARMGYPDFPQVLEASTRKACGEASNSLWLLVGDLVKKAHIPPSPGTFLEKIDSQAQATHNHAVHIKQALFEIYQRSSSRLSETDRHFFEEKLRGAGMDREFERAALELTTAAATRRRAPLKV